MRSPFAQIKSDETDCHELYQSMVSGCMSYISSMVNADGSVGDNRLVNDTADAYYIDYNTDENDVDSSAWWGWLHDNELPTNTDSMVRNAFGRNDCGIINHIVTEQQNPDGGWGLNEGYSSDVLDTLLVIDFIADRLSDNDSWVKEYAVPECLTRDTRAAVICREVLLFSM